MKTEKDSQPEVYSDEEVNELATWLEELTLKQVFFIKKHYEQLLKHHSTEAGSQYVQ